ncbi:MAG: hypothetical protein GXY44_10610 [Phycisphaerales bacterium]|nr:hypothetical protein [Phycisphaerales bacterium]
MKIDTRILQSPRVKEIYITVQGPAASDPLAAARDTYSRIKEILRQTGGRVFQERVFAGRHDLDAINHVRREIYGSLDDGVDPALLVVGNGGYGSFAGVQVHAVQGPTMPQPVCLGEKGYGRVLDYGDQCWVSGSAIVGCAGNLAPADQAQFMLEQAERLLGAAGGDMRSLARTWMWLRDILSWYEGFNHVRTRYFQDKGMMAATGQCFMPASTGVGVGSTHGTACTMDLIAVIQPPEAVRHLTEIGNQRSAFDYGSAFSRASVTDMPAGETVFISGTADIDSSGRSCHIGDAAGQIAATIENVRAVLGDLACPETGIVQAIAYCKTPEVESVLRDQWAELGWPMLIVVADICRDDLLFEMEAAAANGARVVANAL